MILKMSTILSLALSIGSSIAMASTSIECVGGGKILKIAFDQNQTGKVEAPVQFGSIGKMTYLPQPMDVDVVIFPAGSFFVDKEIRAYKAYYISKDLKIGFWISQAFDDKGTMVLEKKNIFGINQQPVGICQVTQGE